MNKFILLAAAAAIASPSAAQAAEGCVTEAQAAVKKADADKYQPTSTGDLATRLTNMVMGGKYQTITVPAQCGGFYRQQVLALNNWNATMAWDQVGENFLIPMKVSYTQPATPQAPPAKTEPTSVQASTPPSGGGAMLDAEVEALKAQRAKAQSSGEVAKVDAAMNDAVRRSEAAARQAAADKNAARQALAAVRSHPVIQPAALKAATNALAEATQAYKNANASLEALKKAAADSAKAAADSAAGAATSASSAADDAADAKASKEAAAQSAEDAKNASWEWWQILLIALAAVIPFGLIVYFLARKGLAKKTAVASLDKKTMLMEPTSETTDALEAMEQQEVAESQLLSFQRQDGEVCEVLIGRVDGRWVSVNGVADHTDPKAPVKDIVKHVQAANRRGMLELSY